MKKTSFLLFLVFLFVGFSNAQKNQKTALEQYSLVSYKIIMNGDAVSAVCNSRFLPGIKNILKNQNPQQVQSPLYNSTFVYTGCSTIYDLVTNGTPQNIVQDPNTPDRIHVVCMYAPPGDGTSFPNRRTKYYYSTNRGTSWTFIADVPSGIKSGFPVITLASNGNELISNHSGSPQRSQFAYDAAPGLGSFSFLAPSAVIDYIWPRTVTTNSLSLTNKFVTVNAPNGRDSCFWMTCTSLSPPGTFSAWHMFNSDQAETYSIARGSDGRIGILYHINDVLFPGEYGSVYIMESTDNGSTFGTPLKIFNANINPSGDSLGSLRGLQLVYQGSTPKAVFETVKQTTGSSYFPNDGKNNIRFWSTSLPGSDPNRSIKIADTGSVGYHPLINTNTSASDVLTCICRPTIGVSADGSAIFVAFMVPSIYAGGSYDTVSFMDTWLMYSTNNGSNWIAPVKINPVTPIRDWTHPCLSLTNDYTSNYYYANMMVLSDSLPGSYVNHSTNGESYARHMFVRVEIPIGSVNPPPAPVLLSPPNAATCVSVTPTFDWQDVISSTSYRIQVSTSPTFAATVINSVVTLSQYTVTTPLSNNTQYYWRVSATNFSGTSDWSNTWTFTTGPPLPPAPVLIAPPNGTTNMPLTPMLYWNSSTGATAYRVQISMSSSFTSIVFDTTITATIITVPPGKLIYMTVYYWRVCAINCAGSGACSTVWAFVTNPTGIQTYGSEVPAEFKLHNNFPNPFNPVTKIRFDLPKLTGIKLVVFDILGKEIVTLVNEKLPPGKYEVEFSINDVQFTISSGVYFYKLETEYFTDVKKLVLIK